MPTARRTARTAWCLLLAALAAAVPAAARAADDPPPVTRTWAVVPAAESGPDGRGAFDYTVEPGQVVADDVAVRNFGTEPITLDVYAQDARQTPDGPFELLTADEEALRVGAWTRLAERTVTVPARGTVVVPFTLEVPDDAEPGDHAGGIVAVSAVEDTADTALQYRVGTRMYVRVAGPVSAALTVDRLDGRYAGRVSPVARGTLAVDATVVNTGNVRLAPAATAHVRSLFGLWQADVALDELGEILPDGAATVSAELAGVPPLGPLWVSVDFPEVASRDQDVTASVVVATRTVRVWAVPWTALVTVACLASAGALALRNARARRRARSTTGPRPEPAVTPAG